MILSNAHTGACGIPFFNGIVVLLACFRAIVEQLTQRLTAHEVITIARAFGKKVSGVYTRA